MINFSFKQRSNDLHKLSQTKFDVVIIGGGITGAGIAVQAAGSGLKTALIEMQDFAEGTSSRSTKLVHGGIRYLKTFDVDVVKDTVQERARVQRVAPHIPRAAKMLMPIYADADSTFTPLSSEVAMTIYDQLSGVEKGSPYAHRLLAAKEAAKLLPNINHDNLQALAIYLDYKNNDARLTIDNLKQAVADGAVAVNHVKATQIQTDGDYKVVMALDGLTQAPLEIHGKVVVNAAGPWYDQVASLADRTHQPSIRGTKGIHLVVDESTLKVPETVYFDSGHHDGRMIFVIPRFGKTYFGTTDTDYHGDYQKAQVEQADVDYLLSSVNEHFPTAHVQLADVESSWVGIRPLIGAGDYNGNTQSEKLTDSKIKAINKEIQAYLHHDQTVSDVEKSLTKVMEPAKSASQVSRGFQVKTDDGVVNVSGGKLTDYRLMGEVAMQQIQSYLASQFNQAVTPIDSTKYQISGGHFDPDHVDEALQGFAQELEAAGLDEAEATAIASLFGSNATEIARYVQTGTRAPGLTLAETSVLTYSLEQEMVVRPIDFLLRRTNYLLFDSQRADQIEAAVMKEMSRQLDWDEATETKMRTEYYELRHQLQLQSLKEEQRHE